MPAGRSGRRAVIGTVDMPPVAAATTMEDRAGAIEVTLLAPDMMLNDADDALLAQGRNLCLIGRELIQFRYAVPIAPGRFRLRGLMRGLRGTEWAVDAHAPGEAFLLIEEDALTEPLTIAGAMVDMGGVARIAAVGLGDADAVETRLPVTGEALMPPSPVHLRAVASDGGWRVDWVRRSRAGWRWANGADVPLAEESERYAITVRRGEMTVRQAQVDAPFWTYSADLWAQDAAGGGDPVTVEVAQIGTFATGRPARIVIH